MKPITNLKMLKNSISYHIIHNGPSSIKKLFRALWRHTGGDMILSERSIKGALKKMPDFQEKDGKWYKLG